MNCNKEDILTIPRGNDFRIHLCLADIVPSESGDFSDVDNLKAYISRFPGVRAQVETEIDTNGDLFIVVPAASQLCTTYGIELTGEYNNHSWRFKCCEAFKIADCNCDSTVQGMETFGVETYYLHDVLWFEDNGKGTFTITSDGHADIVDGTLILQSTDDTNLSVDGATLTIIINK